MQKFAIPAIIAAAVAVGGCGSTVSGSTKTVTVANTQAHAASGPGTATTSTTPYLGPPCSQMDVSDSGGYSMCDVGNAASCPAGWISDPNTSGACDPDPSAQDTSDTATTDASDLTGPVGTPYSDTDAENNVMSVTLTQVIDPAQGKDEFNTPDNGDRFVGAKFRITGTSGSFQDDANTDAVLLGSNGQSYQPDFNDIAGCTNFNAGEFNVSEGQSVIGCVVFQVPDGVKAASVQWGGQFGGTPATWTVG